MTTVGVDQAAAAVCGCLSEDDAVSEVSTASCTETEYEVAGFGMEEEEAAPEVAGFGADAEHEVVSLGCTEEEEEEEACSTGDLAAASQAGSESESEEVGEPPEVRPGTSTAAAAAAAARPFAGAPPRKASAPKARRLPELSRPPALPGVKSKRRPVMSLQNPIIAAGDDLPAPGRPPSTLPPTAAAAAGRSLLLGLAARTSLAGLTAEEAAQLRAELESTPLEPSDESVWSLWRHEGLKVKCLSQTANAASPEVQLAELAEDVPHVIFLLLELLLPTACAGNAIIQFLQSFQGALVVVETPSCAEAVGASLLETLGITTRWAFREPFTEPDDSGFQGPGEVQQ